MSAARRGAEVASRLLSASRVFARAILRGESEVSFRTRRARRVEVPRATASREPGRHSARGGAAMARLEVFPRARRGRCARTRFGCVQRRRERADELPRRRPKARDEAQLGGRPREARVAAEDAAVQSQRDTADVLRILKVVRAIRNRGHLSARLDPLGRALGPLIEGYETMETSVPDGGADIARLLSGYPDGLFLRGRKVNAGQYLGLHDARPEREFYFGDELTTLDAVHKNRAWWSLDDILLRLRAAYCGTLSAEFDHLDSAAKKRWMRGRLEGHARDFFDADERASKNATLRTTRSTPSVWQSGGPVAGSSKLEEGLWLDADEKRDSAAAAPRGAPGALPGKHFPSAKRFGLEGAEALIPGLQSLVETAAERGVEQIVVGMAHRGRLNILHSVFAKPLAAICAEMRSEGASDFNVGDVWYHLGARAEVRVPFAEDEVVGQDSKTVEMTMAPNPSHLEAVNAVAAGMVRSKQARGIRAPVGSPCARAWRSGRAARVAATCPPRPPLPDAKSRGCFCTATPRSAGSARTPRRCSCSIYRNTPPAARCTSW